MINLITVRERGATPRNLKRAFNRISKESWFDAAKEHHVKHTAARFTPSHAKKAGYGKRKGEGLARDSKAFRRSYFGRKLASKFGGGRGKALPLVWSGFSQQASRFPAVSSTSGRARLRFRTPVFNFRHPKSRIRMSEEFRRILPDEQREIAENYDDGLDKRFDRLSDTQTTVIR